MESFLGWDLVALIKTVGYIGLFVIVFAESGLFIGFFLPGDSLLFTAGFLASQGYLNVWILAPLVFTAAILGDNVGYAFGKRVGPSIFKRENSLLFHKDHLERSRLFYAKHGGRTLILARFLPIVRTFAPILAGVGRMQYRTFLVYNIVGGALWSLGLSITGFYLGHLFPDVDRYLIPIILGIIFISILPMFVKLIRHRSLF